MKLTDLERLILTELSVKADNEHGYNRIAIDGYSIDDLDAASEKLIRSRLANGVSLAQPFGPRLVAFGLSSLTAQGRRALESSHA